MRSIVTFVMWLSVAHSLQTTPLHRLKFDPRPIAPFPRNAKLLTAVGTLPAALDIPFEKPSLPSNWELAKFGLPNLAIWLLQPILSLIDTSVLGMNKVTTLAEVAALGPGITFIDSTSYLFYFLGIVTTNLFASALRDPNPETRQSVLVNALTLSLIFGGLLLGLQYGLAPIAVKLLSGASIASIPFAQSYARIRSIAAPFALVTIVAQSAFLTAKDAITPLKAVLVGALFNLFGDLYLVNKLHLGVNGAAWATCASQVASTLFLVASAFKVDLQSTKTIVRRLFSTPRWQELQEMLSMCFPIFGVLIVKTVLWTLATFATSSRGPIDLATHQIVINFFLFFCIYGDVIEQIVQSFATYTLVTRKNGRGVTGRFTSDGKLLVKRMEKVGMVIGLANALLGVGLCLHGGQFFSRELAVQTRLSQTTPYLFLAALPHSMLMVHEAVLLINRDLNFLSFVYLFSGLFFLCYQMSVYNLQLGVGYAWKGMAAFQWLRVAMFYARRKWNDQQIEKEIKQTV